MRQQSWQRERTKSSLWLLVVLDPLSAPAELAEGKAPVIVTLQSPYTVPIRHTYCVPQVHVPAFMKILLCNLPTLVGWDKLQLLLSWDVSASLWTE